jgi:SAM-dependent methyltransferase
MDGSAGISDEDLNAVQLAPAAGSPAPPGPDGTPAAVRAILRHPVTLAPLTESELAGGAGYLALRSGGLSIKNDRELDHFRKAFVPSAPADRLYARRIKAVPAPLTTDQTLVLDIGCGPYDCLSAMPGTHIFLDDLMNLYVEELGAEFAGTRVCARTELMPFADDSVDIIYSVNMIDHVDDMPETVKEMHRILKPAGAVHCQTYWNSHPLLPTEPGVFDRYFLDEFVCPYFEIEHLQTFAMGDPAISRSYTMDVAGFVLRKRPGTVRLVKPRSRYENPSFLGPQSHISAAIHDMDRDELDLAQVHVEALTDDIGYVLHHELLTARLAVQRGELGAANQLLKVARSNERVRGNPYARIAIAEIETRRLQAAVTAARERADRLAARIAAPRVRERARKIPSLARRILLRRRRRT